MSGEEKGRCVWRATEAAEDKGRWIESAIEKRVSFGLAHFLMLRIERILRRATLSPPFKISRQLCFS
jgi:hypothetical protein